jgi:glycosyltransferase involved in cell wall biosynthesis
MMVRGYIPVPRPEDMVYAPIDLALSVAEGLTARGHQVTFFCPNGSVGSAGSTTVQIETLNLRALVHNQAEFKEFRADTEQLTHYVPEMWDKYFTMEMLRRAQRGQYDLLWFHHAENALDVASEFPTVPIVYTVHDPIYPWYREMFELYESPNQHFISISKNQRRDAPDFPYLATVHNGIDPGHWPISTDPEDYLLYAGRIVPEKGVKEAIQVAKKTNHRLLIVGPVHPGASQDYYDQYIRPQLDDQILHLGFVERGQMWRYYQKAKAVLTPVQWEEPFGLTTIEAMACGTPVISLNRGAAPEIIVDGKTGFVVDSIAEMIKAVGKIGRINRNDCREHVKAKFSSSNMVDGYEAAFRKVLRTQPVSKKIARDLTKFGAKMRDLPNLLKNNVQTPSDAFSPGEDELVP